MEFKTYKSPQDFSDFSFPDVSLPPLEDFKYNPDLYIEENGVKKPRPLTPEEEIQVSIRQSLPKYDLSRPLYNYSKNDSEMFNNEDVVYNPYLDMNEIYSKTDPFTWGDSFLKTAQTFRINAGASWASFYYGIKGALKGDLTAIYDNPHVSHIADLTENLEKINPQFKTQDQAENPLAPRNLGTTFKSILPAFGTVGAGLFDIVLGHFGASLIGAAGGAVSSGGVGAVPGAIAANILQLGRDLNILKNTVSAVYALSKGVNTAKSIGLGAATLQGIKALSTANNIRSASQLVGTSLLFSNAEAALQAELNARTLDNKLQTEYFNLHGKYASGEDLKRIEDSVEKTRNWTYGLNLALLSVSNAKQFGNLLRGKVTPQILNDLPVGYVIKDGVVRATNKGVGKHILKNIAGNAGMEGLEEWGQSLIDDVVGGYFDDTYNNKPEFLNQLGESLYNQISSQQAWTEFLGGALIGGITSGRSLLAKNSIKKQTEAFVNEYNSTTNLLFDANARDANLTRRIEQAAVEGNSIKLKNLVADQVFNLASQSYHRGAGEANMDLLHSMETMDNQQFNSYYGLNLTQEQQVQYAKELQSEFGKGLEAIRSVYGAFKRNPFQKENWFVEEANKLEGKYKKEFKDRAWTTLRENYARHLYLHDIKTDRLEAVKRELPIDDYLLTTKVESAVKEWRKRTKDEINAGITRNLALYTNLSEDPLEAMDQILATYQLTPQQESNYYESQALEFGIRSHEEYINKMQDAKGQKSILKEIFEFLDAKESETAEQTTDSTIESNQTTESTPVNPEENISRENQEVKEEDLTQLDSVAEKLHNNQSLTAAEQRIYDNNKTYIDGKVDELEEAAAFREEPLKEQLEKLGDRKKKYPIAKYFEYKGKVGTFIQRVGNRLWLHIDDKVRIEITEPNLVTEVDSKPMPQAVKEGTAQQERELRKEQTELEKFAEQENLKEEEKNYLNTLQAKGLIKIVC